MSRRKPSGDQVVRLVRSNDRVVRFQHFGLCPRYRRNESRKMKSEQQEVYDFLVFVISHFGTGGQPEPTVATLHLFTEKYVGGCIKRAIASGKLAHKYVEMGREYLVLTKQTRAQPNRNRQS